MTERQENVYKKIYSGIKNAGMTCFPCHTGKIFSLKPLLVYLTVCPLSEVFILCLHLSPDERVIILQRNVL